MKRLILKSFQSPGDIVMLTAAVRDLHRAYPRQFQTDVRTSAPDLWINNPHLTPLDEREQDVQVLDMHYPLIHQSNQRPLHFIHGYTLYLESQLNVRIPVTEFRGDIYLDESERQRPLKINGVRLPDHYWIVIAGGKYDFTAKWWNPASYQRVVDHLRGTVEFVQCGESSHWHLPLDGVTDLLGRTSIREFVRLMHHAEGVLCPVTFAMHLAAAVEMPRGSARKSRPCVVIAGGREPTHWAAYPNHQFLSTQGMLSCCADGGCWKSRCQTVGDGDLKDRRDLCERPIQVTADLRIPECLEMITPQDVIRRIEMYLERGHEARSNPATEERRSVRKDVQTPSRSPLKPLRLQPTQSVVHCLNVQGKPEEFVPTAIVVNHLRHFDRGCRIRLSGHSCAQEWEQLLGLTEVDSCHHLTSREQRHHLNGQTISIAGSGMWPDTLANRWLTQELHISPIAELANVSLSLSNEARENARSVRKRLFGTADQPFWVILNGRTDDESATDFQPVMDSLKTLGNPLCCLTYGNSGDGSDTEYGPVTFRRLVAEGDPGQMLHTGLADGLAVLAAADCVVSCDSELWALGVAAKTPTLCLWKEQTPERTGEPSPLAKHYVHEALATESGIRDPYRPKTVSSFADVRLDVECASLAAAYRTNSQPETVVAVAEETHAAPQDHRAPAKEDAEEPVALPTTHDPVQSETSVEFFHGLGDAANFAKLIPLYVRRGHKIGVKCTPDKELLFRAAGATIVENLDHVHPWAYPPQDVHPGHRFEHVGSKCGWNISEPPLPDIGPKEELWTEYCQCRVRVSEFIPTQDREFIAHWTERLARPLVLLHSKGNTAQAIKSLPDDVTARFYREFLDRFDGTLILLDWDNRVPRLPTHRIRHLTDMSGGCSTGRMFALMESADLMIGVDSGPLHAAGLTDVRKVGIWMPGHYPARYSLPDPLQLNLVLDGPTRQWNRFRRVPWNIVEQPGQEWDPAWLAEQCRHMLQPPRYLNADSPAPDVQLQHWIQTLCRGNRQHLNHPYQDRNRSFDLLLRESSNRFEHPTFVETGTIRSEEDWSGAGFSTYIFGQYLQRHGGVLHSVDLTPAHCEFARTWTECFGETVQVHQSDSLKFLQDFGRPIDVLYLDSLDTTEPGHADHAYEEYQRASPWLHDRSLVLFDDTPWNQGAFVGKGARAVPWLLNNGWRILYAGYQVLLERDNP